VKLHSIESTIDHSLDIGRTLIQQSCRTRESLAVGVRF
jgi:hypothetical protein